MTLTRELAERGAAALGPARAAAIVRFAADFLEQQARARGEWNQAVFDAALRGNATALEALEQHWAAKRRSEAQG